MRNSKVAYKVALCGMISALSLVLMMLTTLIPVGTYALPIISGILLVAILIEFNTKWAFAVYFVVSVLSFLLSGDKEAALYFVMFFGYYPILKNVFERIKSKVLQWILKYALFNAGMIASFYIGTFLLGVPVESFLIFGYNLPIIFLLAGNLLFYFYDKCVAIMVMNYIFNLRGKLFKIK